MAIILPSASYIGNGKHAAHMLHEYDTGHAEARSNRNIKTSVAVEQSWMVST